MTKILLPARTERYVSGGQIASFSSAYPDMLPYGNSTPFAFLRRKCSRSCGSSMYSLSHLKIRNFRNEFWSFQYGIRLEIGSYKTVPLFLVTRTHFSPANFFPIRVRSPVFGSTIITFDA